MIPPHFFGKEPIPRLTNPDLLAAVAKVRAASGREAALRSAYALITERFVGKRFRTYLLFWLAFETDANRLWQRQGFMHCTQQNYLLRVLLVQSGWFTEDDIRLAYSLVWYVSPHQYLLVRLKRGWLALDPWNDSYSPGFGYFASGFGFHTTVL